MNKEDLIKIFEKLNHSAKKFYVDFNELDGKIGDGDLGITILHGLEEISKKKVEFENDLGKNFLICSKSFVKRSGSSFGTLIAFSFINISKRFTGKKQLNNNEIIELFNIALNTILTRGKTKIGDKTIADSLNFIIKKLENKSSNYAKSIFEGASEAIESFKGKKILTGRARMFDEKTKDIDDPGMYAIKMLSSTFL
tara:strand:- start:121 stop:711 length:591 start_codon:yes stop_codon:yes gene_type:complete